MWVATSALSGLREQCSNASPKRKIPHFELESLQKECSEEINMFPNWPAVWISFSLGSSLRATHLMLSNWHMECFTDGPASVTHGAVDDYLSHRCFGLCFSASRSAARRSWWLSNSCCKCQTILSLPNIKRWHLGITWTSSPTSKKLENVDRGKGIFLGICFALGYFSVSYLSRITVLNVDSAFLNEGCIVIKKIF